MGKQRLFISYCWKDGNTYADELETQLKDTFDVKRDKSQLIANDNLYDFMAEIANCENVIIVLTAEYVKSLNCMLEMSYLVSQDEWGMKAMVLVIDDSLYSIERKFEVMNYWILRQKNNHASLKDADFGKALWEEEKEYIDLICENMEKCKKQVLFDIFRQFISGTFRQSKTSTFIIAYISRGLLPGFFLFYFPSIY